MTLIVHALGAYASYSREKIDWRNADYEMNMLVKSLKGHEFKGYKYLKDAHGIHKISHEDGVPALNYFSAWAAERIESLGLDDHILVPVPSSSCTSYDDETRPYALALAIQQRLDVSDAISGTSVERWLRFKKKMEKSHKGGTRDVDEITENLRMWTRARDGAQVILIDDVKTTGGHLRACARVLRDFGMTVDVAIVAATTVWVQEPDPFNIQPSNIEGFADWGCLNFCVRGAERLVHGGGRRLRRTDRRGGQVGATS